MAPWGLGLGRDLLGGQAAVISTLKRLGGWDPFLNTARFLGVSRWGPGIGAMVAASAARYPTRIAISDDDTTVDYCTLDRQATNLAAQLRRLAGSSSRPTSSGSVGILCRNHRFFVIAQVAAERAGIDVVLMSPALPAPKLYDVIEREQVAVLIADEEFAATIDESGADVINISADGEGPQSLSRLAAKPGFCPPPARRARLVLLTSGTTGPPKGARRANRAPSLSDLGLFTNIPYQIGETYLVCPPLFHAWGLSQATTALATGSSVILRRKFDAGEVLSLLETTQIDVLAVVPLMMRRILRELDPENSPHHPRIVASSGNVLPGHLALAWMDTFGDHLY
ncbi:MAG: AMP-binding protein, partial [Actinomycetia bacterium]|nr:AMP-binding protein [Actinomycetes bacterium]